MERKIRAQSACRPTAYTAFFVRPVPQAPRLDNRNLKDSSVGRSHRSKPCKAKLKRVIDVTRELLAVPAGYRIAIVPASDTGAVEMALWSLLGPRGVDVLAWESFSEGWVTDVTRQLKLRDVRVLRAPYGELPDLGQVDFSRDVVFVWNGTTSGVRVPDDNWIKADGTGSQYATRRRRRLHKHCPCTSSMS